MNSIKTHILLEQLEVDSNNYVYVMHKLSKIRMQIKKKYFNNIIKIEQ